MGVIPTGVETPFGYNPVMKEYARNMRRNIF